MSAPESVNPSGSNTISSYSSQTSHPLKTKRRNRLSLSPLTAKELFNKSSEITESITIIEALHLEVPSKKKQVKAITHTTARSAPISRRETDQSASTSKLPDIVTVSEWVHHTSITSPRSKFPHEIDGKESNQTGTPKKPSPRDLINSLFNRRKEDVLDFSQASYSDWQSYKNSHGWGKKKKEPTRKSSSEADRLSEFNRKTSEVKTLNLKKLSIEQDDFHFISYYFLNLTNLYVDGSSISNDDLKLLSKFHLQAIQLTNCPNINNRVSEILNEFWGLKALKISLNPKKLVADLENESEKSPENSTAGCNEDFLIELSQKNITSSIQELHLTPCHHLSAEAVKALGTFENLTILGLSHAFIPADSFHYLSKLKLTVLKIEGYQDERDILLDISIWNNLNTLILNKCAFITSKRLSTLNVFKILEHLSLENCPIDNASIPFLNEMRALRYLFLKGCNISSRGLLNLNIPLNRLEISTNDKISLRALKLFLSTKKLQSLRLEWNSGSHFAKPSLRGIPEDFTSIERKNPNFQVRDYLKFEKGEALEFSDNEKEAWEKVRGSNKTFPNARLLDLNGSNHVLNSDLSLISQRYPHLTHLLLLGLNITNEHLEKLLPLPLQALQLSECYYLPNSAAEILDQFPYLVALKLSLHSYDARYQRSATLTEGILEEIANRALGQRLEELQINPGKTLSEAGLKQIGKMAHLRTLSLCNVSPETIGKIGEHLSALVHLSTIHFIDCSPNDGMTAIIGKLWPHIHTLSFDYCGNEFTHKGIAALISCNELTTLSLKNCELDDQALQELSKLETVQHLNLSLNSLNGILSHLKLPFLRFIDLSSTKITDDDLIEFIKSHPKLKYIYLNNNNLISDKALIALGELKKIRFVSIQKCLKITKKAITKLKKIKKDQKKKFKLKIKQDFTA